MKNSISPQLFRLCVIGFILFVTASVGSTQHMPVLSIDMKFQSDTADIRRVALSPDGSKMIIPQRTYNKEPILWDTRTGEQLRTYALSPEILKQSDFTGDFTVQGAEFSPDGKYLLILGGPHFITMYETETGREIYTFFTEYNYRVAGSEFQNNAGFSPDGTKFIHHSGQYDYMVRDAKTGTLLSIFSDRFGRDYWIYYLPNGRDVCLNSGGRIFIVNSETGEPIKEFINGVGVISPNHQYLAYHYSPGYENQKYSFELFDLSSLTPLIQNEAVDLDYARMGALSNGKKIILSSTIYSNPYSTYPRRLIEPFGKKLLFEYPMNPSAGKNEPTAADDLAGFFPDGKRFWTVNGTTVHIWDISDLNSSVKNPAQY